MRIRVGILLAALVASIVFTNQIQVAQAAMSYPTAPQNLSQAAISGGIRVSWTSPADTTAGLTGYQIEYSTSGTDGTWQVAGTVAAGIYTFDISGIAANPTFIRVGSKNGLTIGSYGYPWADIYSSSALRRDSNGNVTYDSNFGLSSLGGQASNTYSAASFSRVKYRMETTISGSAKYVEADFYKWSYGGATGSTSATTQPTISGIAIPSGNSGQQWQVQANVNDLNVYSNNTAVLNTSSSIGRLEIWPWDYGWGVSGLDYPGNAFNYDSDDTPTGSSGYASFQVHDLTNGKGVFSWNRTSYTYTYTAEVGYGSNSVGNPDWTFCSEGGSYGSCPAPTSFKFVISINPAITPLVDGVAPVASRIDAKQYAKNGDSITVSSTEVGTVYLVRNSVTVSNLASITSAASNQKSSVSISSANTNTTLTTSALQDGKYNLYAVDPSGNISTAVTNTITMDSTPPTVISIYLSAGGSTVYMNMSETVTHTSMGDTLYTISDGGPTNNVGSTGGSAMQLQISVYRAIPAGATVNFAYTPSAGAASGRWVDLAGNELAAIALGPITNNSTASVSIALTVPATIYKGIPLNISTVVNYPGKVTFLNSGKRIAGCIGKVASGTPPITVSCSYKASTRGNTVLSAIYTPSNSSISGGVTPVQNRFILNRSGTR